MSKINRKQFLARSIGGVAGISLLGNKLEYLASRPDQARIIGKTGIRVSPVCFGAPRTNDESLIRYALEKGIFFIDTGRSYGNGNNEKLVGRSISGKRDKVIIQSKIRLEKEEVPSGLKSKKGAAEIKQALSGKLEASLKALGTSYIDILLYHDALDEGLLFHEATVDFFNSMKKNGTIRAHGFSTHNDCMNLLEKNNIEDVYDVIMIPFNHKGAFTHSVSGEHSDWDQKSLLKLLAEAGKKGIGIIAMKTCSGGPYSPSPDIKPDFPNAVKWVLQHDFISSAAIAMASFEQVNEYLPIVGDLS
ncbi:MAG: aldo/keto reductase [Bacteroidales bacterium]